MTTLLVSAFVFQRTFDERIYYYLGENQIRVGPVHERLGECKLAHEVLHRTNALVRRKFAPAL